MQRAVLVQGSAHGTDHGALLEAILQSADTRRGVALLNTAVTDEAITELDRGGVCAVRFNWIRNLLQNDIRSESQRIVEAEELLRRVSPMGWHVEIHIDIDDLDVVTQLQVPEGMRVVVDHMTRLDLSLPTAQR